MGGGHYDPVVFRVQSLESDYRSDVSRHETAAAAKSL